MIQNLTTLGVAFGMVCCLSKESHATTYSSEKSNWIDLSQMAIKNPFVIPAEKVQELIQQLNISVEELLQELVPIAQTYARPPISKYYVGAAGLGKSGKIYLGVNLEFPKMPLNQSVHAEQFLVALARSHQETEIVALALSAAPCGHCRQFFQELGASSTDLTLYIKNCSPMTLKTLLPQAFGPQDLAIEGELLAPLKENFMFTMDYSIRTLARIAAFSAYAPYSKAKSGVAIQTVDGRIYSGSYLESAAYNPSLSPLQAALISLVADGREYNEIRAAMLVEQERGAISHEIFTRALLETIAPQADFKVINFSDKL